MSHLLQSAGPGTSLIHSDRRLVGGDGRLPVDFMVVAVAFFSGDFQLGLEYRSDEALYIKG